MRYVKATGRFSGAELLAFRKTQPTTLEEWTEAIESRLENLKPYVKYAALRPLGEHPTDLPGGRMFVSMVADIDFGDTGLSLATPCLFGMIESHGMDASFIVLTSEAVYIGRGPLPLDEGETSSLQFIAPFNELKFLPFPGVAGYIDGELWRAACLWDTLGECVYFLSENRLECMAEEIQTELDELRTLTELADFLQLFNSGRGLHKGIDERRLLTFVDRYDPNGAAIERLVEEMDEPTYRESIGCYVGVRGGAFVQHEKGGTTFASLRALHRESVIDPAYAASHGCNSRLVKPADGRAFRLCEKLLGLNLNTEQELLGRMLISDLLPTLEQRQAFLPKLEAELGREIPKRLKEPFEYQPEFTWYDLITALRQPT